MRTFSTTVFLLALTPMLSAQPAGNFKNLRIAGEAAVRDGALEVVGKTANLIIDVPDGNYRLKTELTLNGKKSANIQLAVMPQNALDLTQPGAARLGIKGDATGLTLQTIGYDLDADGKIWTARKGLPMHFWPGPLAKTDLAELARLKIEPKTWHNRKLHLVVEVDDRTILVWLEGLLVHEAPRPPARKGPVVLQLSGGDRLHQAAVQPLTRYGLYLPVDLSGLANEKMGEPFSKTSLRMGLVPFEATPGEKNVVSLRQAGWAEVRRDPSSYRESYDGGPTYLHDPRMPFLRVPLADYAAVHVLAVADADEGLTNALTVQAGRYGHSEQVVQYDFFGQVPRVGDSGTKKVKNILDTPAGRLYHVRIPMQLAFAQDLSRFLELTLTKEIRLARRQPDPNRFRYRPLGLPSGVKIAALTLERAPLQMRVGSKAPGHAFEEPGSPTFEVKLRNTTPAEQSYTLLAVATHLDGSPVRVEKAGKVPAGQEESVTLTLPVKKRGYHDLAVTLGTATKQPIVQRLTSFALLPPDTRKFRHQSPFGTWDFSGGHFTSNDPYIVGTLHAKLGIRFGMFGFPLEERKKYGVVQGSEPVITNKTGVEAYDKYREKNPDAPRTALIFHENAISRLHVSRIPDIFHDRPPYKLSADEEKRFQLMWNEATTRAKELRAKHPDAHIRLGNGTLTLREEFYRHKFPHELFDSAGNENAGFGRPPETQPPDAVSTNATIWMDRELLDAYGYKDKAVSMCYEVCYPSSNPGNLTLNTQADYFVRHGLHALAWGIKEFRPGCISDVGSSYYYSNWGASGFCNKKPELNVKPAFVAFATLTRVLDGARFVRDVSLGSPTVYGLEFDLPSGERAYALWTVRGQRPVTLRLDGEGWRQIDSQANESALTSGAITVSGAPLYVVGKGKLQSAEVGEPTYDERPLAKSVVLASLGSLEEWTVEPGRNAELEHYNMLTPRRKGEFAYTSVARLDGKEGVLQVKPLPLKHGKATMPMYSVLTHKKGLELPGTPTEMGCWIHGNSGWGRLIYELTDASGQRWISLGAQQRGEAGPWLADWLPKEELAKPGNAGQSDWNTEDVFGTSRINFDGWRYVAFPLPGSYPGEHYPWPANSQWRWDKDGVVHYPLTLRKVVVELSDKVLHVRTYEPPPRAEIHLRDLIVGQGDTARVKTVPYEERR